MKSTHRLLFSALVITVIGSHKAVAQNNPASAEEKKCLDYKTGAFNYVLENRPELIIRTDSTQIELNPITEVEAHSSIVWKSDCEYVMTYTKVLNYPKDVSYIIGQKNECQNN